MKIQGIQNNYNIQAQKMQANRTQVNKSKTVNKVKAQNKVQTAHAHTATASQMNIYNASVKVKPNSVNTEALKGKRLNVRA